MDYYTGMMIRRLALVLGYVTIIAWGAFDSYTLYQILQAVSK